MRLVDDAQDLYDSLKTLFYNLQGSEASLHLERDRLSDLLPAVGMVTAGYDLRINLDLIPNKVEVRSEEELEDLEFRDDYVHLNLEFPRIQSFMEEHTDNIVIPDLNRDWIQERSEFGDKPRSEMVVDMLESGTRATDIQVGKEVFPFELGALGKYMETRSIRISAGPFGREDEESLKIEIKKVEPKEAMKSASLMGQLFS